MPYLLALLLILGCGTSQESDPGALSADSLAASPDSEATYPLRLVDGTGTEVVLSGPPERIVAIGRGVFMVIHLLYLFPEARGRLVGLEMRGPDESQFISRLDRPAWTELAREPGIESLAALHPDLVMVKGGSVDPRTERLAALDIPVFHLGLEDPEHFFRDLESLGKVLGTPERAAEVRAFYQARLDRVDAGVASLPPEERPRVLVLGYHPRGGEVAVKVPAASWMQTLLVERAGGRAVWLEGPSLSSGWTVVGFEQVAAWDPDIVVVCLPHGLDGPEVLQRLRTDPGWAMLRAVQDGRLVLWPGDQFDWNTPDPRWVLGLGWLASTLHPDRFPELEPRAEVFAFYRELYGLAPAQVEAWILPQVALDSQ